MSGGVSLVLLIAIIGTLAMSVGAMLTRHYRAEAVLLRLLVLDALRSDRSLRGLSVTVKVHHPSRWASRPVLEITGAVPTAARRDQIRALTKRIVSGRHRGAQVLDRMVVVDAGSLIRATVPPVLIVEDDEASLYGLAALLTQWGYRVETATDGELALQKVRSLHPSVVITDVAMPHRTGLELLEALRRDHLAIPVIVLTGQGTPPAFGQTLRSDLDDYLEKPVDVPRLRLAMARALEARTGAAPALQEEATTW